MKIRKLALDAVLAAVCAVLGMLSLDFGNINITFESLPIFVGALLFGPVDGLAVATTGNLVYQLLRYGVSATTLLWVLPYSLCGLLAGRYALRKNFEPTGKQLLFILVLGEILVTTLNTGVLYIDSKIYGYYSAVFIFGMLIPRYALAMVKAAVFSAIMPMLLKRIKHALQN